MGWNADLYMRFEIERTKPARDLLAALPTDAFQSIIDLGCGPGNSTGLLQKAFPHAQLVGLDSSKEMLIKARQALPDIPFLHQEITQWVKEHAQKAPLYDLIFANAALHWVPDHATLFPALLSCLKPGGLLAVQMPDTLEEPSHKLMSQIAKTFASGHYGQDAQALRTAIAPPQAYYDWLFPKAATIIMWHTRYYHMMPNIHAILEWIKGAGLRPFLSPLTEEEQKHYLTLYHYALQDAYPEQKDGQRLFPFPRFFLIAQK